jgi:CDP-glycerol glycerophosphotransferase (TagB/SpsB family)
MAADKVISAAADGWVINPFGRRWALYYGLCDFDFVFLQHGLTTNDLSEWLHTFKKNIALFVTCGSRERDLVLNQGYGYSEKVVRLLGFPRHDRLADNRAKVVTVMPSWRENLAGPMDPKTSVRAYNREFVSSGYYVFWQSLLTSETLASVLRQSGYTMRFFLHPALEAQIGDFFSKDPNVVIEAYPYDYSQALSESALLLTDHSSLYFEHAYLRKPVVAAFFEPDGIEADAHPYKPDPRNYNLGPLVHTLAEAVEVLCGSIASDCPLEPQYEQRMDELFAFHDRENSRRVYEAVRGMECSCCAEQMRAICEDCQ